MNLFQRFQEAVRSLFKIPSSAELEELRTETYNLEQVVIAKERVLTIAKLIPEVPNYILRDSLTEIVNISSKGIANLEKNPQDIKRSSKFLNYYLDIIPFLVVKYVKLAKVRRTRGSINKTMRRIEEVLTKVSQSLQKQIEKMYSDDLQNVETEIDLLQQYMKNENY